MLGADVGTSLVTVIFSFDLSWLAPLLIFVGVTLFLATAGDQRRPLRPHPDRPRPDHLRAAVDLGRRQAARAGRRRQGDLRVAHRRRAARHAGRRAVHVLCYSSLAVVLLVATLASLHVIALPVALGLVLGANLGSGLLGMLSTLRSPPEARRVTLGNFLFKLIGCVLAIPLLSHVDGWIDAPRARPGARSRAVPLRFNVALALLFIFWTERIARDRGAAASRTSRWPTTRRKPRHLDPSALDTPPLAIANAAREAMRIGDIVEDMLTGMLTVLQDQRPRAGRAAAQDGRRGRRALHGGQALPDADLARGARRKGRPALGRHRVVHDQPGAGRRHHRARAARRRGQEDREAPQLLRRRHGRDLRPARAAGRQPAPGHERVPERRPEERAGAARAEGAVPRPRARVRRFPPRPPRRQHAGEHRDLVAAPRPHLRPEAHQLALLLDRLPDPRGGRRAGAHAAEGARAGIVPDDDPVPAGARDAKADWQKPKPRTA